MNNNINIVNEILDKYKLSTKDKIKFLKICYPIFTHEEFQRRMNAQEFAHHANISLGYHILSDAVVTYLLAKKKKMPEESLILAVTIAMFHDLYEIPWQNSGIIKSRMTNRHGFTHPIESAINSSTWYPQYFENKKKSEIIIDGIIHHMYPFPVRALDDNSAELNNENKLNKLNPSIKNLIIKSSIRSKIGHISLCRSKYQEGRIMSKADKFVSFFNDSKNFNAIKACITGINPDLESYKKIRK